MKLLNALKRLWPARNTRPPAGELAQSIPTTPLEPKIAETAIVESAPQPEAPFAALDDQISKATQDFRRARDASAVTAVDNYKKLCDAAESQHDEHLRTSLIAYADNQLIQSIRWLLDSEDQFTAATTTTHENS